MLIASRDYTTAKHDTGIAEKNQQQAKQLHEEQLKRKSHPLSPEFQLLPAWLPAEAFPCTVTSSSPQIHKMVAFIKSVFLAGLIFQTLKPKKIRFPNSVAIIRFPFGHPITGHTMTLI